MYQNTVHCGFLDIEIPKKVFAASSRNEKNIVKWCKHFFGYFNTLETRSAQYFGTLNFWNPCMEFEIFIANCLVLKHYESAIKWLWSWDIHKNIKGKNPADLR